MRVFSPQVAVSLYIIISLKNRWKQSLIIFKAEEYRLLISSVRLHNYVGIGGDYYQNNCNLIERWRGLEGPNGLLLSHKL